MTTRRPCFVAVLALAALLLSFSKSDASLTCVCGLKNHGSQRINIACRNRNVRREKEMGSSSSDGRVLCEKEIVGYVPEGYEYVDKLGFYKLYRTSKKYAEALEHCKQDGAHLAIPDSKEEADALADMLLNSLAVKEAFIGINDIDHEDNFVSVLGTSILNLGYQLWYEGNPDNCGETGEDCLTLNKQGLFDDEDCERRFPFLCEKPLKQTIPEGYKFYPAAGGGFYRHYLSPTPFHVAEIICKEDGGHVAVPETYEEAQVLVRMYDDDLNVQESLVGITDAANEGTFLTVTGKQLTSLEFQNWGFRQPNNNAVGGENCVTLLVAGTLNDVSCSRFLPFFCEIPVA